MFKEIKQARKKQIQSVGWQNGHHMSKEFQKARIEKTEKNQRDND